MLLEQLMQQYSEGDAAQVNDLASDHVEHPA